MVEDRITGPAGLPRIVGLPLGQQDGIADLVLVGEPATPDELEAAMLMMPSARFMHLEGRPLLEALPRAVDDIDAYEWMDGEIFGGMVLGWNFGDGHLNGRQLLEAVQAQCGFEAGELRVVMVESQPLFGRTMKWKIMDAATGPIAEGETEIGPMRAAMAEGV